MPSLDGSWGRIQTFSKGRVVREAVFGLCTGARLRVCKLYAVWCTHVRLRRPLVRVVALHGRGVAPGSERTQSHEELPPPDHGEDLATIILCLEHCTKCSFCKGM